MSATHFEKSIQDALAQTERSFLEIASGDSHKLSKLQGYHKGLTEAREMYRKAIRTDMDEEQ